MSNPKLNQIVAVEDSVKKRDHNLTTDAHKLLQKPDLFNGFLSQYSPIKDTDADGNPSVVYPPNQKKVQQNAREMVNDVVKSKTELWNVIATKDYANCEAKADIVLDDKVIAYAVPVTHLIFLEKQLNDLKTLVLKLPVLDPSKSWKFDSNKDMFVTEDKEIRIKTKKVPKVIVKIQPSEHSQGDSEIVTQDEPEGKWLQEDMSSAFSAEKIRHTLERITKLQEAVKFAREEANAIEVKRQKIAGPMLSYIFDEQ